MKCFARCMLMLLVVFIACAVVLGTSAWFAASWLDAGDAPVKADRMMILSGEPLRAIYAAELYRDGFAKEIYLTRTVRSRVNRMYEELGITFPRPEDLARTILVKKGVSDRDIHIVGGQPALSTVDEAYAIRELFGRAGAGSLLIVTSRYHVRRAKMVFQDAMPDVAIAVIASPNDRFPDKWWTDQFTARQVVLECTKIAYYLLGGRFLSGTPGQLP